jgi:methylenetetrahydrofolate dehydrogenase (NADP+)/methenyltetrahydrofolate cyclohydrolase
MRQLVRAPSGAIILDGKATAARLRSGYAERAAALGARRGFPIGLAVILVGADPASAVYVRNKERACQDAGIRSLVYRLAATATTREILELLRRLNGDPEVDGILVQLPLPAEIDASAVADAIDPAKDVDGAHPQNVGLLAQKRPGLRPCTPYGVIRLAEEYGIALRGRRATLVGASILVGRPMALELLLAGATVTICHTGTPDVRAEVQRADLVVVAVGKPGVVQGAWIQSGAALFDVGINRTATGTIVGDVDYTEAALRAGWITPVPGGLGPMTVAMLISNTVEAATRRSGGAR